jgi:hypothetical protein
VYVRERKVSEQTITTDRFVLPFFTLDFSLKTIPLMIRKINSYFSCQVSLALLFYWLLHKQERRKEREICQREDPISKQEKV